jgi:hypothetical protein
MTDKESRSEWLKKDLEDASREAKKLPSWVRQSPAHNKPLELSREAQKQRQQAASSIKKQIVLS